MKRQQFLFRPNPHSDLHQRAWAYLQACPAGQKNDYIAWAIIRLESQKEFENVLREILKEPEQFVLTGRQQHPQSQEKC